MFFAVTRKNSDFVQKSPSHSLNRNWQPTVGSSPVKWKLHFAKRSVSGPEGHLEYCLGRGFQLGLNRGYICFDLDFILGAET
jgi:hypothetical protein